MALAARKTDGTNRLSVEGIRKVLRKGKSRWNRIGYHRFNTRAGNDEHGSRGPGTLHRRMNGAARLDPHQVDVYRGIRVVEAGLPPGFGQPFAQRLRAERLVVIIRRIEPHGLKPIGPDADSSVFLPDGAHTARNHQDSGHNRRG